MVCSCDSDCGALFQRKFINRLLKHCEMLRKAVISTVDKTKDHAKLLEICFLQKTLTVFWGPFLLQFPGKSRTGTGKKKKRNCATITSFSTVYTLIGYGSRPMRALAVSTEPIASQLVRVRETSFAIQRMAIYPVIPLFNVWITELWLLKIWCPS